MTDTLRVRAVEGRLLQWEGDAHRGYVGWSTAPAGEAFDHEIDGVVKLSMSEAPLDVPNTIYYRKALACGDLDDATGEALPGPEPEPDPDEERPIGGTLPTPGIDNTLPGERPPGGSTLPEGPAPDNELPRPGLPPLGSTLPEGPRPDNTLPRPELPDELPPVGVNLPTRPGVDNELPGEQPGIDNELPPEPPPFGTTLPTRPEAGQELPGEQPGIDNTVPGRPPVGTTLPTRPEAGQELPEHELDNTLPEPELERGV
jgi:hypothetical protein